MSGASRFRHLFTPIRLGPITLENRIVFSAHLTNYARDGLPTEAELRVAEPLDA